MLKIFTFVLCVTLASTACGPQETIDNQGKKLCCYNDANGIPTIGIAFQLTSDDATTVMAAYNLTVSNILTDCERNTTKYCLTNDQAEDIFYRISYPEAEACVDRYVPNLPTMTRAALTDMAFGGCETLNKFVHMKTALTNHDWKQAAEELRNSVWCKQVKERRCNLDYNCILNVKCSINWNENNWAHACNFKGNDLSRVRIAPEQCDGKCASTPECTHFIWTKRNGGTCWMKKGSVSKSNAFPTNDGSMVCGVPFGDRTINLLSSVNTINVSNRGSRSISVGFFKNVGAFQPSFVAEKTITVSPGETQSVSLAYGWEGRLQKLTGAPADPATWAEIHFNAWQDMTFCDISLIRGFNGAMVFSSVDGSLRTGFTNDLRQGAPSKYKVKDSKGYDVLQPTEPYTGGRNYELVEYYRKSVSEGNAYIIPDDHASSHGTNDKRINLEIY